MVLVVRTRARIVPASISILFYSFILVFFSLFYRAGCEGELACLKEVGKQAFHSGVSCVLEADVCKVLCVHLRKKMYFLI